MLNKKNLYTILHSFTILAYGKNVFLWSSASRGAVFTKFGL